MINASQNTAKLVSEFQLKASNVMDRIKMYRFIILNYVKDCRRGRGILGLLVEDSELSDSKREELIDILFRKLHLILKSNFRESDLWFLTQLTFVMLKDGIDSEDKAFSILDEYIVAVSERSPELLRMNKSVVKIFELCDQYVGSYVETRKNEKRVAKWCEALVYLAEKYGEEGVEHHFMALYVQALNMSNDVKAIQDLYEKLQKVGKNRPDVTYFYLVNSFKNMETEKVISTLETILHSKEIHAEGLLKMFLAEMTQQSINFDDHREVTVLIYLLSQIRFDDVPLDRKIVLYQCITRLYVHMIEIRGNSVLRDFLSILSGIVPEITSFSEDQRLWFAKVLFNVGLTRLKENRFPFLHLSSIFCPDSYPEYKLQSYLAAIQGGLQMNDRKVLEDLKEMFKGAEKIANERSGPEIKGIVRTLAVNKIRMIVSMDPDPKQLRDVVDDCLQDSRIGGETMEQIAYLLGSKMEFAQQRIRCLKSALNKPGRNQNDLAVALSVFIPLIEELLTQKPGPNLSEVQVVVNKLLKRLKTESIDEKIQDGVMNVLAKIWNFALNSELIEDRSDDSEILKTMARSLQNHIPKHRLYLEAKMKLE